MKPLKMIKSFKYAGDGLFKLLKSENNFQFHFLAAVIVCAAGIFFNISHLEWLWIAACIAMVMAAEAFNTAIEKICDLISKEKQAAIADIKDIAAAGVLITAIFALVTALIIFGQKIQNLYA